MPFQNSAPQKFMGAQKPKMATAMPDKAAMGTAMPMKAAPIKTASAKPISAPTPERKKMAMQNMVSKYGKQV